MIYFMIVVSIIVADKILKEYFKSSFRGKHRKPSIEKDEIIKLKNLKKIKNRRKEKGRINERIREQIRGQIKKQTMEPIKGQQKGQTKELIKEQTKQIEQTSKQKNIFTPKIELLENKGAASGILASHPKLLKGISSAMLCFCALALGRERQKGEVAMAGIGYALILGGGLSNFIDRMKKGSVTDYVRFPEFPVKKISQLVFNLSDFGIFAGVFCLLFRKK